MVLIWCFAGQAAVGVVDTAGFMGWAIFSLTRQSLYATRLCSAIIARKITIGLGNFSGIANPPSTRGPHARMPWKPRNVSQNSLIIF